VSVARPSVRQGLVLAVDQVAHALADVPAPLRRAASVLGLLVTWSALVRFGLFGFEFFVTPLQTGRALLDALAFEPLADDATLYRHAAYTAGRVLVGTTIAITIAVPLGLLVGTRTRWRRYLFPAVELLRPIPPIAWVPLVLVVFPSTRVGVLFVVFLGAFFPTMINTVEGVDAVDEEYRRAAESLGASRTQRLRHVLLPAALPSILTGVTIGLGLGWITVVAAEMITGTYGIGHVIFQAYRLIDLQGVVVGMIAIGALGGLSTAAVVGLSRRLTPWRGNETRGVAT
jgi:NitT/TauT family transport system permease protein